MKFVLVVIAVLVLFWLLRRTLRDFVRTTRPAPPPSDAPPQTMLACAHCGLHLPGNEALPGRGGVFCGEAHRRAYEAAHPSP